MSISLNSLNNTANNHESRIKALENKTSSSGKMIELWSGGHGGGNLTISNHNFDDYAIIIGHCDCHSGSGNGTMAYSTNLFCPTNRYGARSNCFCDLTGDDAAGMYLVNNHTINFTGWAGVWLQHVYGLKLYYSFSYNIIYRAMHLLEKIFYVLNKGGVSL